MSNSKKKISILEIRRNVFIGTFGYFYIIIPLLFVIFSQYIVQLIFCNMSTSAPLTAEAPWAPAAGRGELQGLSDGPVAMHTAAPVSVATEFKFY